MGLFFRVTVVKVREFCILFNNNFGFEIMKQFSDPGGRFILRDIKTDSKIITLLNIYAPNNDNPNFFEKYT